MQGFGQIGGVQPLERRKASAGGTPTVVTRSFTAGAFSWTAPEDGTVKVAAWGGGGAGYNISGTAKGGGGGFCYGEYAISAGDVISGIVANYSSFNGNDTTVDISGQASFLAGGGRRTSSTIAGSASGGQVNVPGNGTNSGGTPDFPGSNSLYGGSPGGGGYAESTNTDAGTAGLVILTFIGNG